MISNKTGPDLFRESLGELHDAFDVEAPPEMTRQDALMERAVALLSSLVSGVHAQTAAHVMAAGLFADAHNMRSRELQVWAEVIPGPPLVECWGKENRRPACTELHTDDCKYADPPPEPEHVLLGVGTRVLVTEKERDREGWLRYRNPVAGRISGYDMHKSKYRYQIEYEPGIYAGHDSWAFVGNHVEVHPDGPECPPPPKPVKREPTGPRVYVEDRRGKQGYVIEVLHIEKDDSLWYRVQFLAPGVEPVLKRADSLTVIAPSQVTRCENGQTRRECTEIDPCEPCQQDADEEGDKIEESMGLR